jgi:lysophospholipase L1-like esterase
MKITTIKPIRGKFVKYCALIAMCFCAALAADRAQATGFATVAPFDKAPAIDGVADADEWAGAVGFTQVAAWNNGRLATRRALGRLGWDKNNICLLMQAQVPAGYKFDLPSFNVGDGYQLQIPMMEFWIDPHHTARKAGKTTAKDKYFQFLVGPNGYGIDIMVDGRGAPDERWKSNWSTAAKIDSETNLLTIEVAIPWKDLGVMGNPDGQELGLLLGYTFYSPFQQLAWSPIEQTLRGFNAPQTYPAIKLQTDAPTVQLDALGPEALAGKIDTRLQVHNPGTARTLLVLATARRQAAKDQAADVLAEFSREVDAPAGTTTSVPIVMDVLPGNAQEANWEVTVTSADGKDVFFRDSRTLVKTDKTEPLWDAEDLARAKRLQQPQDAKALQAKPGHVLYLTHWGGTRDHLAPVDPAMVEKALASLTEEQKRRSLVERGATARLWKVFEKAEAGQPVTVGFIGGSITEGAGASIEERTGFPAVFGQFWARQFPKSPLTIANAAIGATGSNYAVTRASQHLFPFKPDLVIVEFCVNDPNEPETGGTYEGLIRQILRQPQAPAVIMFTVFGNRSHVDYGPNPWHREAAKHYNLPIVSARRAVGPEMIEGKMNVKDFLSDSIHPNDAGHDILAASLMFYIQQELRVGGNTKGKDASTKIPDPFPAPIFTDQYDQGKLIPATDLKVLETKGYGLYGRSWFGGFVGDEMTFEVKGLGNLSISLVHMGTPYVKAVEVTVDDRPPVTIDPYWTFGFASPQVRMVARNLAPGTHRVRLKTIPSPKNPGKENFYQGVELGQVQLTGPLDSSVK